MPDSETDYQKLMEEFSAIKDIESGQMFGKPCLKVTGKAFVAQQLAVIAFKLTTPQHAKAMTITGACLWAPEKVAR